MAYSVFMTVIILATTPQYAYMANYGACIQSFRKAYEQKKSLNYVSEGVWDGLNSFYMPKLIYRLA